MPHFDKDDVLAAMTGRYAGFYERWTPLKLTAGELRGPCPLHGGDGPNFAVNPETGLWHCFTQCGGGGDVFEFLMRKEGLDFPEALAAAGAWSGLPPLAAAPKPDAAAQSPRRITETYDYTDEAGALLFQAVRYEPKDFRQRRPDGRDGWIWSLAGTRRVLYRLPEVLDAAAAGKPVYFCEGEKDADRLAALGLCATSAPMGAMKKPEQWDAGYTEALRGASVVILPDNDPAGAAHGAVVAAALHGAAKRVRVVLLLGLPDKGDVSDWLDSFEGMDDGGTAEALFQLAKETPDWLPAVRQVVSPKPGVPVRKSIAERVVDMADIGPPPTELPLLWWVITEKMTHWLSAPSGAGKTTLAFNIVTAIAEGTDLWGRETPRPVRTVYVDRESGLIVQQTKLEKLYQGTPRVRDRLLFLDDIQLPAELPDLVSFCQSHAVDLVIFDTAAKTWNLRDENDNSEVGRSVTPVLETLKSAGVASLVIDHTGKNGSGARGASAKAANVDVVLDVDVRGEGDSAVVSLSCVKHKLLGFPAPLVLKRVGNDRYEPVDAGGLDVEEESASKLAQCRQFIIDTLGAEDAPLTHGALLKQALTSGIKKSTFAAVWRSMKNEQEVRSEGEGYALADPFAD